MASKQDQNAASRGILECSICLEAFKMPKCLPCIHTFCFECLEKYGKDEQPGDEMPCPLCRQLFKIPAEGFKKLPNNIFIEQIATTAKLFASLAIGGVKCESCDKGDATHYCVDCAESMCDVCSGVHRKQKATRAHKVVSLSEKEGSQVYMRARPAYCDTHEDKQLELYCYEVNCSKAICLLCSAMEHRNHLCADIQTSSRKFCDELISCYPHLDESAEMNATEQKSLDEQKSNLLEQISACERAVQERGEQLKRIVDEQCREVLSQLEKFKDERIKAIQARKEEVDGQSLMLSSLRAYMEELVKKGSACAISQSAKDLVARAKQLHADQVEFRKGSLSPDRVRFEPANVADITSGRMALIGWISVNDSESLHIQPTLGEMESSLSETQQQLTQLNECVLSLQASNEHLTQQVQADKAQHEAELTKMQGMHSDDVKTATVKWNQEMTCLKNQLLEEKKEAAGFTTQLADANTKMDVLTKQLNEVNANKDNLTQQLTDANTKKDDLTKQLNDANTKKDDLTKQLNDANTKKDVLTNLLNEANAKKDNLTKQLNDANKEKADLQTQLSQAEKHNFQLVQKLDSCGIDTLLVLVGLSDGHTMFQRVYHISLERPDRVSTIDSTPAWVGKGAAACVMGNTLYAVGIERGSNELWKWNAASDWMRCADMPSGRQWHCAEVVDSTLFGLGGRGHGTMLSSVEAYNTQTNKWFAAGQLTHAVYLAACVSYNNSIYVFGGEDANNKAVAHVQAYDAAQHKCTLLHNAMPRACSGMRAVMWETYAILLGHDTCFIYNFESETWQERASFKTDVIHFGLVVNSQTLYIAGGGTAKEKDKDNNWIWTCTAEVRSVSVHDVLEDKREARWAHHATLLQPALVHAFSSVPLYRPRSTTDQSGSGPRGLASWLQGKSK